jgi:hypothetical protein
MSPLAGVTMASLFTLAMRGGRKPLVVLSISTIAEASLIVGLFPIFMLKRCE